MSHYESCHDEYNSELWEREKVSGIKEWPKSERIDAIGRNGNTGEHYDAVEKPSHYQAFGIEAIEVIASSLTEEGFEGYCYGNWMKYRFRLGHKDSLEQDFKKSEKYKELFESYKHLCKPTIPF